MNNNTGCLMAGLIVIVAWFAVSTLILFLVGLI